MIRATPRLVWMSGGGLACAALSVFVDPGLWLLWPSFLGALAFLTALDSLWGSPLRKASVELSVPERIRLGESADIVVRIASPATHSTLSWEALCDLGEGLSPAQPKWVEVIRGRAEVSFTVTPTRRGDFEVGGVWLRGTGPYGLVRRTRYEPIRTKLRVVPNVRFSRMSTLELSMRRNSWAGMKIERYVGDGSEFHALREYVPGYDARSLDWRGTARHRRLLCRDFRAERNRQVILALDCGRLMGEPIGDLTRLDHGIHAALRLAHACVRSGDRVGLFAFDEQVRSYAEPVGGVKAFARLKEASAGLEYSGTETNFTLAFTDLAGRLKRRSLVVVMTDFADAISAELLIDNLQRLRQRQLVVFVALRDGWLDDVAGRFPQDLRAVYRANVASDLVRERERVLLSLRRSGIRCIDSVPERVTSNLLNCYFDIRRRELV